VHRCDINRQLTISPFPLIDLISFHLYRRYDTYTPTRNVVFHDFEKQSNGHGVDEWFKRQRTRLRQVSIRRVKTALHLKDGEQNEAAQANLGLYGLGKRRSISLLNDFANVDLRRQEGNTGVSPKCSGHEWVPYDKSISPVDNLFDNPDNLDPQPEYPFRTNMIYYEQAEQSLPALNLDLPDTTERLAMVSPTTAASAGLRTGPLHSIESEAGSLPSATLMLTFWVFGLIVWYLLFMNPRAAAAARPKSRKQTTYKDV